MKKAKHYLIALLSGVLVAATVLSGCGQSKKAVSKNDDHLTVYLWENRLMKNIVPISMSSFQIRILSLLSVTMIPIYIAILRNMVNCRIS